MINQRLLNSLKINCGLEFAQGHDDGASNRTQYTEVIRLQGYLAKNYTTIRCS